MVAFDPLKLNTVPLPSDAGLMLPEMLHVGLALATKLTVDGFPPLIATAWFTGLNVNPAFEGVIVYLPFGSPLNVNIPWPSGVVVAVAAPLRLIVVPPLALAGLIDPVMLHVCNAKLTPGMLLPAMVTDWLAGLKTCPDLLGIAV